MICGKLVVEKFKTAMDGEVELHTRCRLDKGHAGECSFGASLERLKSCKAASVTSEEHVEQAEVFEPESDEKDMAASSRILRILSFVRIPLITLGVVLIFVGICESRYSKNHLSNRYYVEHHDCVFVRHVDSFVWVIAGQEERVAGHSIYTCKGIDANVDVDDDEK